MPLLLHGVFTPEDPLICPSSTKAYVRPRTSHLITLHRWGLPDKMPTGDMTPASWCSSFLSTTSLPHLMGVPVAYSSSGIYILVNIHGTVYCKNVTRGLRFYQEYKQNCRRARCRIHDDCCHCWRSSGLRLEPTKSRMGEKSWFPEEST